MSIEEYRELIFDLVNQTDEESVLMKIYTVAHQLIA